MRRALRIAAVALLMLGTWQLAQAGWIHAKARLAQTLISLSWTQSNGAGASRRPWPGADLRPIARLSVPSRAVDLFVLDGASGRALAFGPGHVSGTARPGAWGNTVLVAHRDTHFAFLRDVAIGEEILLETAVSRVARYRVSEVTVVGKGETRVMDSADAAQLTLITCWPFDAIRPGTDMRYVVIAERVA